MKTATTHDTTLSHPETGPLVSVIIPTYKRMDLVPRAIACVRRQTYANLEIIVVDDGSPDDTEKVVRAISDNRIRYIRHEKNKGLPAGRNTGIRAARGEYIAFLDDDDQWKNDKLEKQLRAMESHHAVLCGAQIGTETRIHPRRVVTLEDLRKGNWFDPSGLLVRADVLREVMFDEDLRTGEDWDGFIRIAQRCSIGYVPEPLVVYDDGAHPRMTNEAKRQSMHALEQRTAMLLKHQHFFGDKWLRFHLADSLLSYIGERKDWLAVLRYTIRRCGIVPVAKVITYKLFLVAKRLAAGNPSRPL